MIGSANMPNDRPGDMARRIADLERAVRELRAARNLDQGSITPEPGMGIRTGDFDGTDFAHPGTTGNYFGGDGLVANAAYFRPGSVSNDALTNPVVPNVVNEVETNFAIPGTSNTTIVSFDATVPDNCTRLLAHLTGDAFVVNPNTTGGSNGAGSDIIIANVTCGGNSGLPMGVSISGSNGQTSVHCSLASLLTGLTPGGTVTLTLQARAGFQSFGGANASNQANLSASLFWLR